MTTKENGDSYGLRVRLRGYSDDASAVTWRLVLGAVGGGEGPDAADVNVAEFSTSSSTDAWLDADTDNMIYLPASRMRRKSISVIDDSSGNTAAVRIALCELRLYAQNNDAVTVDDRFTGLYAAEYYDG
jgi:hypothetical protein